MSSMTVRPALRPGFSSPDELWQAVLKHIRYTLAQSRVDLTPKAILRPLALAIRDRLIDGMLETEERYRTTGAKRLYYLSMEFLMGRALSDNLCNLQLTHLCREALAEHGVDLDEVLETEVDAGLGNGGLGRLAACFLESMATLGMPGFGYGIDYEFGMFTQEIQDGYQREKPDRWKKYGTPLLIPHPALSVEVPIYGRCDVHARDAKWTDQKLVLGVPSDLPVAGYGGRTVNYLRLFAAQASEDFDIQIFNRGDYIRAVEQKIAGENISRVLYPSDQVKSGKELRLLQEYFLVACALRDILRGFLADNSDLEQIPDKIAIQMNDTHPALAVPEMMRLLVDEHGMEWKRAWEITRATFAYTNHTLLPEALEKWPLPLMEYVLPRHMNIIFNINHNFLVKVVQSDPLDFERPRRMSIIEEAGEKQVRMALLAIVGSHSVNGVSELHSELVKKTLVPDFAKMWPERFNNKTNGVAHRRWILKANPGLSQLLCRTIGEEWITDFDQIHLFEPYAGDAAIRSEFREVKRDNKQRLAKVIAQTSGVLVDPESMFDVQIKRFHEYKRQLLNLLRITYDYLRITEDGETLTTPATYVFAGKSAPAYLAATQIIKLINNVARTINADKRVRDQIKIAFVPDYRVSLAEIIIPAADLSEQISTAGMEASGTGNMKLAMNGALTMATLDGANIEILEKVGSENMYVFGLTAEQIAERQSRSFQAREIYDADPRIRRVIDALSSDRFCPTEFGLFRWVYETMVYRDRYFHLADLPSYIETHERAQRDFTDQENWSRRAMLNVARMGKFSSDRTIREYAAEIWHLSGERQTAAV
ncbi:MAG TPA: glycogen/starch/alpha-glucan phosphorylase [Terriglobales bacterium]|nr:glycogen/starch/alpha-glucan phosphorylase [Terriglobales bacterium]